jgi:hypothetical protein
MLAAALEYFEQGYSPWPIVPGQKMPIRVPAGPNGRTWGGHAHVPLTAEEIHEVWGTANPPDIAVVVLEGHLVLDLDPKNNKQVASMYEELIALTRCERTPSGGLHAYFRCEGKARTEHPALGIDMQGYGTLVVCAPSRGYVRLSDSGEAEAP